MAIFIACIIIIDIGLVILAGSLSRLRLVRYDYQRLSRSGAIEHLCIVKRADLS